MKKPPKPPHPHRWFDSSPEVIRLVVMMYVKHSSDPSHGRTSARRTGRRLGWV